ncbi:Peptide methionine sulfoxide reductase A4, chloroplastic [Dionaea muscipula]
MASWFGKLGFGSLTPEAQSSSTTAASSIAQGPDDDAPATGQLFAQFGAGCFWGVELAFQRVPGVTKTEVGYSQGFLHNPSYEDVCSGTTKHSEVVRVQYDPKECSYDTLLDVFWARHDPTTLNRQGNDVGTQYRSGIYYYTPEQEKAAKESLEQQQKLLNRKIVTEILPAKKFYRAEEYHQQYLEKGGRLGSKQSAAKGCSDPIRCYG